MKVLICLLFLLEICLTAAAVPVFIWSNDKSVEFPNVLAGHHVAQDTFMRNYMRNDESVKIFFIQNELSVSDILVHGGVYGTSGKTSNYEQLKNIMLEYTATFLPSVEMSIDTLLQYSSNSASSILKLDAKDAIASLSKINLKPNSLVVIDFLSSSKNGIENDKIVGEAVTFMKMSKKVFTAYLTTKRTTEFKSGTGEKMRHLLAMGETAVSEEVPVIRDGNFMMHFEKLYIGDKVNDSIDVGDVKVLNNRCSRYNSSNVNDSLSCSIELGLGTVKEFVDMKLEFVISTSSSANPGFWYVREATFSYTNGSESVSVAMNKGFVDPTPIGLSYSCNEQPAFSPISNINFTGVPTLHFVALQMEVFMANATAFSHYNDCVGFFTIGIWMFIICAAILITILLFGVIMLMGITTMDRYDDPKAKSIVIGGSD